MKNLSKYIPEQLLERGLANVTALHDRGQYAELVVERLAERPAVVQVNGKRVVAEHRERLVMVPVHVAHDEVVHGQVHEVQHPTAAVVRRHVSDGFAVTGICARPSHETTTVLLLVINRYIYINNK